MRKILFLFTLITASQLHAQLQPCATSITQRQLELLRDFHPDVRSGRRMAGLPIRNVAITAHLIRRTDGTGGMTEQELSDAMEVLNAYYSHANLVFFLAGTNEIHDSQYFDFNTDDEVAMGTKYDVAKTINVYFANSVGDSQGGSYCGYAYFPGGPDRVLMDNSCAVNGSTLPHEIGHYFTLYHTHGNSNSELTDELVARVNCETAGDELCDTPADPQLGGSNVNASCTYTGTSVDANNDPFTPDPRNIMSYSLKFCRDVLTDGQYSRIDQAYDAYRSYLYKKIVSADFTQNLQEACAGTSVSFYDISLNATSWSWYFEGGMPETSTEQNPEVLYETGGTFDVQLIVSGAGGNKDTLLMVDQVLVADVPQTTLISKEAGFEGTGIGLEVINEDEQKTFEQVSGAASEGQKSVFVNFYEYGAVGAQDYLVLPLADNSFSRDYRLTFDYAYTYYDNTYFDQLAVLYRGSCEADWVSLWDKSGAALATKPPQTGPFSPTLAQWRSVSLEFTVPEDLAGTEVAFRTTNGYGNNLYIDNIRLEAYVKMEATPYTCPNTSDGVITVQTSGTQNYTFSLDGETFVAEGTFADLAAGVYSVTVKDELERTYSESLSIESRLFNKSVQPTSCYDAADGSATFTVSGGGTYQFSVDGQLLSGNNVSDLTAGTHTVSLEGTDNGCFLMEDFEITSPEPLAVEVLIIDPKCFGGEGTVDVEATGGSGALSYQVDEGGFSSNSSYAMVAGDHLLTVKDENECELQHSFTIAQPDSLYFTYEVEGFLCTKEPEGQLTMTGVGGLGPYSFWVGDVPLSGAVLDRDEAGSYEVTVVDGNGCEYLQKITVEYQYGLPEKPVINLVDGHLQISDTDADISWYHDGELMVGEVSTSVLYGAGTYEVALTVGDGGCSVRSDPFVVLGLSKWSEIMIVPNPVGNHLSIKIPNDLRDRFTSVTVYDMSGQLILKSVKMEIENEWPAGIYLLEIQGESFHVTRRIIKK
ncbi:MAG: T9SS type A sorting domain-containing protein [Marinoscillum sp.]|uniref:T9SS type A sorting domain-containing protein n=1 Tax=Marinoscillum sp. TaxID=2024838 RepID=UPI0032FB8D1D